jgi:hypothetical protein
MVSWYERTRDRFLTWKTGISTEERAWKYWYETTVNYRATDITNMFENFKHVIIVDSYKFFEPADMFAWQPISSAKRYFWPNCSLASTCVWRLERVSWNSADQRWHLDEIGGHDTVFVVTNCSKDAIMIALTYS